MKRRVKSCLRRADTQHAQSATQQREHDRVDPDRPGPEHEHRVADLDVAAFNCMQRSRQRTTTGHKRFRRSVETNAARSRLDVDVGRPAAAQSVVEAVSDSVNFSLRAACGRLSDQTVPARVTGAMNVEKSNAIAFAESLAVDVE